MQNIAEYTYAKSHVLETIKMYINSTEVATKIAKVVHHFEQIVPDTNWDKIIWDITAIVAINRVAPITSIIGQFRKRLDLPTTEQLDMCVEIIRIMEECRLLITTANFSIKVRSLVQLNQEAKTYLTQVNFDLPLLEAPLKLESNMSSGYHSFNRSVLLGGKHHDYEVNLKHLDRCNSVAYALDERVYKLVEPTLVGDVNQFEVFHKDVCKFAAEYSGKAFYLTHRYDERGRTYAHGYHFNTQGKDYIRAPIEHAHRELAEDLNWLFIDISNHYGNKLDYTSHKLWCLEHLDTLEDMYLEAKYPAMYTKAVLALRDTQAGKEIGHLVSRDASASGTQILSVLTRCKKGMYNSGVTSEKPMDVYTELTKAMASEVTREGAKEAMMQFLYGGMKAVNRHFGDDLDTFFVGATEVAEGAVEARNALVGAWQPFVKAHTFTMPDGLVVHKRVWSQETYEVPIGDTSFDFIITENQGKGKGVSLAADVTHAVDGYIVRECQARGNYDLQELLEAKERLAKYKDEPVDRSVCVSIADIYLDTPINGAYLYEIVCYTLGHIPYQVTTIHDDFRVHPNHADRVGETYNRLMWELYHSNLLMDILKEITGKSYTNNTFDAEVAEAILTAPYSIC